MTGTLRREQAGARVAMRAAWVVVVSTVLVAGCATGRHGDRSSGAADGVAPSWERDGPDPHPPDGLALVPDAQPRIEPIRPGGPNKPYEALGMSYVPLLEDRPYTEHGLATWYGRKFHGHRTSSGEPYDMYAMTAAHPVLPIPSYARVRNPANGREVIVRINDRGPFHSGRVIDLSYTAALKLGVLRGATPVDVQRITGDDIRTGAWRAPASAAAVATAAPAGLATAPAAQRAPTAPPSDSAAARLGQGGETTPPPSPVGAAGPPPDDLAAPAPAADSTVAATSSPVTGASATLAPIDLPDSASATRPAAAAQPPVAGAIAPTDAAAGRRAPSAAPTWWLQLGAFHQRGAADRLSHEVADSAGWLAPLLAIAVDARWFRLQAGPYANVADARDAAERLRRTLQRPSTIVARP